MVEWGVCGEGKEWEGLCVGMPSIARAAAGNDANPRLQPATSQTDNEHDASLWRKIPPLAAILPCRRHLVNHPAGFPAEGRAPRPHDRPPAPEKFFFSPCSGSSATCPPLPPKERENCGAGMPAGGVARACEKIFPAPNILRTTCLRPYAAVCDGPPSRPGLSHLAY